MFKKKVIIIPLNTAKFQLEESIFLIAVRWFLRELWAIKVKMFPLFNSR